MKKKFLFALTASTITAAAAVALMPHAGVMSFAEGCEHEGNHYEAVAATCESAGNKEFWACCVCHEQFVTAPGKGTWDDKGAYAGPALASTHAAYLAPLAHTPGDWNVYDRGDTLGVNASCSDCGEACFAEDVNSVAKGAVSTAEWTTEDAGTSYKWKRDEATGKYSATTDKGSDVIAAMKLNITKSGTVVFDYTIGCELGWDYFTVFKNIETTWTKGYVHSNYSKGVYTSKGKGSSNSYSDTVSLTVEAGDTLIFTKIADGSNWYNGDTVTVEFKSMQSYGLVNFDTNGGSSVYPGITINGNIATDLPSPTKDGYVFDGWYASSTFSGSALNKGDHVGDNATVYAKWWDVNESHALTGTYKGFGYKVNATNRTAVQGFLSNITFDVNFKGEVVASSTYWAAGATSITGYEDGEGTIGSYSVKFDETNDVIYVQKSNLSDDYGWVFVKDSTQAYTTGTVIGCTWGGATPGVFGSVQFPLADGTNETLFVKGTAGVVYPSVTFSTLKEDINDVSKLRSSFGFQVIGSDESVIETFGYDGSDFTPVTDAYYGVYTNDVASDTTVSKIYVTGNKRMYRDSSTSAQTYTISDNVISYTSGNKAEDFELNKTTMKFVRSIPTVTITYNLNGHVAALEDGSGVFKLDTNTQLACKGAWLYSSDLAKVVNNKSTDGEYLFEGWYKDAACSQAFAQCSPTEDLELFAKWTKMYTVTLVLNNGEDDRTIDVKGGNTPSITNPTRDGWMFGGWFTDPECTVPYVPGAMTENITLYASWAEQPAFAKGSKYAGFNLYDESYNTAKSLGGSSYEFKFDGNGNVYKGTSKIGEYSADSSIASGKLDIGSGKYLGFSNAYGGRHIVTTGYSTVSSDPVPADMAFSVQLFEGESVSFVQTTLVKPKAWLVKVTISGGNNPETFVAYVDCENDIVRAGVDLSVKRGETVTNNFDDVYVKAETNKFADVITISLDGAVVATWGRNGSTLARGDAYTGSYSGTFKGVESTLVLDGFGNATVGSETGTYSGKGSTVTVTVGGKSYDVTISGATYTQVLDGYEGTYTGPNGALVVTGWGECTLNGVAGTYSESSTNVLKVVAGETYFLSVDKAAGTYTAASASPFAGYTFTGTSKDTYGDNQTVKFEFDDSPAITGTVQFGGSSFRATFSGTFVGGVLTLTLTSDIYSNGIVGKTATFAVADGKITCTATQLTSGMYRVDLNAEFTCAGFVAPTTGETDPEPETPAAPALEAGTYTADVEDVSCAPLTYVFVVNDDLASGYVIDVNDDSRINVTISESDDEDYQYMAEGDISIYFNVNEDGSLEVTVEDSFNLVYDTFTMTK